MRLLGRTLAFCSAIRIWISLAQRNDQDKDHPYQVIAYPIADGEPVLICRLCVVAWSIDGKYMQLQFGGRAHGLQTYLLPVRRGSGLPDLPPGGLLGPEDVKASAKSVLLPVDADSVVGREKYSYTRYTIRRNIYRVPIP